MDEDTSKTNETLKRIGLVTAMITGVYIIFRFFKGLIEPFFDDKED